MQTLAGISVEQALNPIFEEDKSIPIFLWDREYDKQVAQGPNIPVKFRLERDGSEAVTLETKIFPGGVNDEANALHLEALVVSGMIPLYGGFHLTVGGPAFVEDIIRDNIRWEDESAKIAFSPNWLGNVYDRSFVLDRVKIGDLPAAEEKPVIFSPTQDQQGNGLGLDIGKTNLRVIRRGKTVIREGVRWQPEQESDPDYFKNAIVNAIQTVRARIPSDEPLPEVLVVSTAGVVRNDIAVPSASWRRRVSLQDFPRMLQLFPEVAREVGLKRILVKNDGGIVPAGFNAFGITNGGVIALPVGNDLAGGSGFAKNGKINLYSRFDEFAFLRAFFKGFSREWTQDLGRAGEHFSQYGALNYASLAKIGLNGQKDRRDQLIDLQKMCENYSWPALQVNKALGRSLGYITLRLARFYPAQHFLLMGQVMKGAFGKTIMNECRIIWLMEDRELAKNWQLYLPSGDEDVEFFQADLAAQMAAGLA